ncbi:tRNA 4-thiouridine(8) synthase ThiI, partial [bacterium]|nr:tRNA 4-thiouridine(8) synthase ThiI [bacterium]
MDGLPIGSNGRSLVLLSGGIDSPVASRLMMNRGIRVDFITFI